MEIGADDHDVAGLLKLTVVGGRLNGGPVREPAAVHPDDGSSARVMFRVQTFRLMCSFAIRAQRKHELAGPTLVCSGIRQTGPTPGRS